MAATYNWSIEDINAKKTFTDKNNNVRSNVIKSVVLVYTGRDGDIQHQEKTIIRFSLVDLSNFQPVNELTNEQVLNWAINQLNPKEKTRIELFVKSKILLSKVV